MYNTVVYTVGNLIVQITTCMHLQQLSYFQRWSMGHAAGLLLASTATLYLGSMVPLVSTALVSFTWLLIASRRRWPALNVLSLPNSVTALRLLGTKAMALLAVTSAGSGSLWAAAGLLLFLGDALDGWLARRYKSTSLLGAHFDEETDAFFLLVLCVIAAYTGRLGLWILLPGTLRYGFVLLRPVLEPKNAPPKKIRSLRARVLFVAIVLALLLTFLPVAALYRPVAAITTVLLTGSFLTDTWAIVHPWFLPLAKRWKKHIKE